MKATIRVMGDKVLVKDIEEILRALLGITFREYPVYRDKKKRTEIDENKLRAYGTLEGTNSIRLNTREVEEGYKLLEEIRSKDKQ